MVMAGKRCLFIHKRVGGRVLEEGEAGGMGSRRCYIMGEKRVNIWNSAVCCRITNVGLSL